MSHKREDFQLQCFSKVDSYDYQVNDVYYSILHACEFGAEEEYHVKVTKTLKEACELAEAGFDYITEIDEAQVFRKRK